MRTLTSSTDINLVYKRWKREAWSSNQPRKRGILYTWLAHGGGRAEMREMKTERRRMNQRTWKSLRWRSNVRTQFLPRVASPIILRRCSSAPMCILILPSSSLFQGPLLNNRAYMGQFGELWICWIANLFSENIIWFHYFLDFNLFFVKDAWIVLIILFMVGNQFLKKIFWSRNH